MSNSENEVTCPLCEVAGKIRAVSDGWIHRIVKREGDWPQESAHICADKVDHYKCTACEQEVEYEEIKDQIKE